MAHHDGLMAAGVHGSVEARTNPLPFNSAHVAGHGGAWAGWAAENIRIQDLI